MLLHKKVQNWVVDYRYMLQGAALGVIHRNPPAQYLGHVVAEKAPVVLLPGILGKWSFMKHLGDRISQEGHPVYIVPGLGYNLRAIPDAAQIVRTVIDSIADHPKGIVLVAHSKGGLVGKYVLAHHNADGRARGMVSIATPYTGSAMAKLVPHKAFKELREDSKVIQDLEQQSEANDKIVSIIPEYDNHVWSARGSFLPGAADNITVPVSGHHKVIFSAPVLEATLSAIEKFSVRRI